ncbi:MAG: hypothetical protein HC817_11165 [Saprospiraceae bacterium]|nr:hypothetical protein [Saprospiraceae bacterium]
MALEEVSGQDLNWFFNQWYYKSGHPILEVKYDYDEANKKALMTVSQVQEGDNIPRVYDLPFAVDIYMADGQKPIRQNVRLRQRTETFAFDAPTKPKLVDFDGDRSLLAIKTDGHSEEEFMFMLKNASRYLARIEALEALKTSDNPTANDLLKSALTDKFWAVREEAVQNVKYKNDPSVLDIVAKIASTDSRSTTRAAALSKLASTKDTKWASVYRSVLEKEQAYPVISSAMQALYKVDAPAAIEVAKKFENDDNSDLVSGVGSIYAENPKPEHISFFEKNLTKVDGMGSINFVGSYLKVLDKTNVTDMVAKMTNLRDIAVNQAQSPWRRFCLHKSYFSTRAKRTQALAGDLKKNAQTKF